MDIVTRERFDYTVTSGRFVIDRKVGRSDPLIVTRAGASE